MKICCKFTKSEMVRNLNSQANQFQLYKMHSNQLLSNVWRVWLSFSSGNKAEATYGSNLLKLHELQSLPDFMYLWTQSEISNPNLFFANPETGQYTKFQIDGHMRKIESINFFKDDIEPTWEHGDNAKGGYFNFSLLRETKPDTVIKVYELLIFMAMGSNSSICDRIKGIRIIDTSAKKKFRCRFEIWVDYQDDVANLDMIKEHAHIVKSLLETNGEISLNDIKFFNIGGKAEQHTASQEKNGK